MKGFEYRVIILDEFLGVIRNWGEFLFRFVWVFLGGFFRKWLEFDFLVWVLWF